MSGALVPTLLPSPARAEVSGATMVQFTSYPVIATKSAQPMVMIAASNDHQLYFKAYDDYSDLDGDGSLDTTYKHSIDYYGYFDSYKCYAYDTSARRFEPRAVTDDKYCTGAWSGNFLNWATMTRMDAVRKLWFGGKRVQPERGSGATLERTYLPHDAHSFAKYYAGDDIDRLTPFSAPGNYTVSAADPRANGITLCNTTDVAGSPVSETVTEPPLLKVVRGNYSLWAANERWQCTWASGAPEDNHNGVNGNDPASSGINAYDHSPDFAQGIGERNYVVRVTACVAGLIGGENCKRYPSGAYKPIGLLQRYGDDEQLLFSMVAGSYLKNKSGGVLVKNMGSMRDEVAVDDDGRFTSVLGGLDESGNAVGANRSEGIINSWSRYRIIKYRHGDGTYGTNGLNANNCTWGLNSFRDGQCQNWGNPFAEIYLNALRYYAGRPVSGTFRADDSALLPGLNTPQAWEDPLDATNYCTRLNVVNVNASVISYDGDNLDDPSDGIGELGATLDSKGLTDLVGAGEGIPGRNFFVGATGIDNDHLCTEKQVPGLGAVAGVCPEAPRLSGTYRTAGLAYWAHTTDIRAFGPEELPGKQTVDTYSVALAPALPKISIPVPGTTGQAVTILPACRNQSIDGNCAIVDFKVVQPHQETAGPTGPVATGKFFVSWEDSEQGGDFDQDMWGTIEYRITGSDITVTTDVHGESTPYAMGFGYVVSGTLRDGYHAHSGINGYDYLDGTGASGCSGCAVADSASSNEYALARSSAGLLEDPLFYAAKWGGFNDQNGNDVPDLQTEWDERTTTGLDGADDIPDKYFFVTNPQALEDALTQVFDDILTRIGSGTAAAVVANTATGAGAAFQALYEPEVKGADSREATWAGDLHALWIDGFGLLREDNPGSTPNGRLDDYNTDPVVDVFFDETEQRTRIRRYTSSDDDTFIEASSTVHELDALSPIWSARDRLSPNPDFADVTRQRSYTSSAAGGRYIFTWMDTDLDGQVDSGEQVDFARTNINAANFGYFDVGSVAEAQSIVDYIRGAEQAGFRNRAVDLDGDGNAEVMRLGDIVHSTPTPSGAPAEALDILFSDASYRAFRAKYANRRQVVYVGANDGMLHAFNAGFFDPVNRRFRLSANGETEHPLGAELWAYVPRNLLPHLKWLTDPDYTHVYYVDLKPKVFDARIFPDDLTHPNGWGTVLVAGFRLGGGAITTDTAGDGLGTNDGDGDTSDDVTMRSAYVVLDVTDPEQPPKVLAELTRPELGFTTSYPAVVHFASENRWYLVFGSGPTELASATSTQNGRLLAYEMQQTPTGPDIVLASGFPKTLAESDSFVGDPVVLDWNLSGDADTLYFGSASGSVGTSGGGLYKLEVGGAPAASDWAAPQTLLEPNPGQPFLAQPTATLDERARRWVFASTGRLFVNADRESTAQQTLYGVIDGEPNTFPTDGRNLVDVSDAAVFADGSISGVTDPGGGTLDTVTALSGAIPEAGGWKRDYAADGVGPSQRGITGSALVGGILFNSAFTPSEDLCTSSGHSELLGLYYKTGTALDGPAVFGATCTNGGDSCPGSELQSIDAISLGAGLASSPSIQGGTGLGRQVVSVITQTSTGAIVMEKAVTALGVLSGEVSWRELR
jgi:type IV pilus assembly protein PilY1